MTGHQTDRGRRPTAWWSVADGAVSDGGQGNTVYSRGAAKSVVSLIRRNTRHWPESWQSATKSNRRAWDILLALCLFTPTVAFFPDNRLFAITIVVFGIRWNKVGIKLAGVDALLGLFLVAASVNLFITGIVFGESPSIRELAVASMFLSVLVGRSITRECGDWLTVFIAAEALVCVVEQLLGVPAVLPTQTNIAALSGYHPHEQYMYFARVMGLSANSSNVAEKLLLALLLLQRSGWSRCVRLGLLACLVGGFYSTFNRTALVAGGLFLFLVLCERAVRPRLPLLKRALSVLLLLILGSSIIIYSQTIYRQFARGGADLVEDSGRKAVFTDALQFWVDHPIRGNGSVRYARMFKDGLGHAHNSFLQTLCTHGLIAVLLWLYVLVQINRANWKHVVPLLVFSMFQYSLFWNISLADMILYYLLWPVPFTVRTSRYVATYQRWALLSPSRSWSRIPRMVRSQVAPRLAWAKGANV